MAPPFTSETAFGPLSNGISSVVLHDCLVVYGGPASDKIWYLDLQKFEWSQMQCHGTVPTPRTFHTACVYKEDHMIIFGGIPHPNMPADPHLCYSLNVATGEWSAIITSGEAPQPRSHHCAVIYNDKMYVYGGKSTTTQSAEVTARELNEDKVMGFYDVHVLDLQKLHWTRVERYDVHQPMLWGHTGCLFRHYMLVFGGFNTSTDGQHYYLSDNTRPAAHLSDVVYVWDMHKYEWSKASARHPSPAPRAMHGALVCHAEMLVYGGLTMDRNGRIINVLDAWTWDIASGTWREMEFCVPYWSNHHPLGGVIDGSTAVICNDQAECHLSDSATGWVAQPCDPTGLYSDADTVLHPQVDPYPALVDTPLPAVYHSAPAREPHGEFDFETIVPPPPPQVPVVDPRQAAREEELRRLEMQLRESENQQRAEHIKLLQRHVSDLTGQVHDLLSLRHRLGGQGVPGTSSPHISPPREGDHESQIVVPATAADAQMQDAQQQQLLALQEQLRILHLQQRTQQGELQKKHREQIEEANRLHEERMAIIKEQQREQQEAQLKLAKVEMQQDAAEVTREQLKLLQQQQQQLLELQKSVFPDPVREPTPPVLPDAAKNMAEAIQQLNKISNRPWQPPDADRNPHVTRLSEAISNLQRIRSAPLSLNPASDNRLSPPRPRPTNTTPPLHDGFGFPPPQPARDPEVTRHAMAKERHLKDLKQQLEAIDRANKAETWGGAQGPQLSPTRHAASPSPLSMLQRMHERP